MKTIYFILAALCISALASCVHEKHIYGSNTLYTISSPIPGGDGGHAKKQDHDLIIYKPNKGFKATITDKGNYLIIDTIGKQDFLSRPFPINVPLTESRADQEKKLFFSDPGFDSLRKEHPDLFNLKFKYFDTKPLLGPLTIPLKIRPKLNSAALKDSFPSQAEGSFNLGLSFGWKFTHNVYNPKKNIFGQNTNRYSLSPGLFLGAGVTELSKANTQQAVYFTRKTTMLSTGGYLMLGLNNFNFGYAFGWDFATGSSGNKWVYHGKMWHGVTVAIDILK